MPHGHCLFKRQKRQIKRRPQLIIPTGSLTFSFKTGAWELALLKQPMLSPVLKLKVRLIK